MQPSFPEGQRRDEASEQGAQLGGRPSPGEKLKVGGSKCGGGQTEGVRGTEMRAGRSSGLKH